MFRAAFFVTALAVTLFLPRQASAATGVPAEFRDGLIWVKVAVEGKSESLDFLLDSGAEQSVVDLSAARRLGLELGSTQHVQGVHARSVAYRLNSFSGQVAGMRTPPVMLALDLSAVSRMCHQTVDGLLGADFFRRHVVQIDYVNGRVRLLSRGELNPAGVAALPMKIRNGVPCVRVGVNGEPAAWARVDTGCNSALQWVAAAAEARTSSDHVSVAATSGASRHIYSDVQLGAQRLEKIKIGIHTQQIFPGEAGLLGNGILSRFRVTFDMSGGRLLLAR